MRSRLALFLFLILLTITLTTTVVDNTVVNRQRQQFVDDQIAEVAAIFRQTGLESAIRADRKEGGHLLNQALQDKRIGKFVILRDASGEVIYQTSNIHLLQPKSIPTSPTRLTIHGGEQYIRVLNLPSTSPDGGFVQIGYLGEERLLHSPLLSPLDLVEALLLTLLGMLITIAFARKLLSPLRLLSEEVASRTALSSAGLELPPLQSIEMGVNLAEQRIRDEFGQLVKGLNALIDRVNQGYEISRAWSFQMAHELKTPMAILNAEVEEAEAKGRVDQETAELFRREIRAVSDTVSAFLLWAEISGAGAPKEIDVIRLRDVLSIVIKRLEVQFGPRFKVRCEQNDAVAVNSVLLDIALVNLLSNAAIHGDPESAVHVSADRLQIEVRQKGPEFPPEVLKNIGRPFNRSRVRGKKGSHGLGLATVSAIARTSGWKLDFSRVQEETIVRLDLSSAVVE